jgi:hypothetical protein
MAGSPGKFLVNKSPRKIPGRRFGKQSFIFQRHLWHPAENCLSLLYPTNMGEESHHLPTASTTTPTSASHYALPPQPPERTPSPRHLLPPDDKQTPPRAHLRYATLHNSVVSRTFQKRAKRFSLTRTTSHTPFAVQKCHLRSAVRTLVLATA